MTPCASAATAHRYCGIISYRNSGISYEDKVYVERGTVSCQDAEAVDRGAEAKFSSPSFSDNGANFRYEGWICNAYVNGSLTYFAMTCTRRGKVVRGVGYTAPPPPPPPPPPSGYCQHVQGYLGEYAEHIYRVAMSCDTARSLVAEDMSTPACVTDCILQAPDGPIECSPDGDPYGAYQNESCGNPTLPDGEGVSFILVNQP
jgi:hypothetical protein